MDSDTSLERKRKRKARPIETLFRWWLVLASTSSPPHPTRIDCLVTTAKTVRGVPIHKNPFKRDNLDSPFCYGASSSQDLPTGSNFLATQLWPSARAASSAILQYAKPSWTMLELGCGPGLPSLTFANMAVKLSSLGHTNSTPCRPIVYATDLDTFALELVDTAAKDQGVANIVMTQQFDIIQDCPSTLPNVDLYIMADVFESNLVAQSAAQLTAKLLLKGESHVWVFAQSDRAQREIYLQELRKLLQDASLAWQAMDEGPRGNLWLCDVDETAVSYG